MAHPLTLHEFNDLRNAIVTGIYYQKTHYIDKLSAANLLNEPLTHPQYKRTDFHSYYLIEAIICHMTHFPYSYDFISYIIRKGGILHPDPKRCTALVNHILFKYASSMELNPTKKMFGSCQTINTLDDLISSKKKDPNWYSSWASAVIPPHKYVKLFTDHNFITLDTLNIYQIIESADPILLAATLETKETILPLDLLDHLIEWNTNNSEFIVEEPHDCCGMGYAGTDIIHCNASPIHADMCTLLLKTGQMQNRTKTTKNQYINAVLDSYINDEIIEEKED